MTQRFDNAAKDWDKGDMRQATARAVFQTISNRIALNQSMDILDFGCGTGLLGFQVASQVKSVRGVDLSEKMLDELRGKNSPKLHIEAICQDIMHSGLAEKFHGIVSSMAMHHVQDTAQLFKTLYDHLKQDGFIALADLEAEDGSFHSDNEGVHHYGFDKEELRHIVESAGFRNVRFHEASVIEKGEKQYPIFLLTALK
jgi:cyclopropane fatty-acyl-phospholipid synthase-like methyltransferase